MTDVCFRCSYGRVNATVVSTNGIQSNLKEKGKLLKQFVEMKMHEIDTFLSVPFSKLLLYQCLWRLRTSSSWTTSSTGHVQHSRVGVRDACSMCYIGVGAWVVIGSWLIIITIIWVWLSLLQLYKNVQNISHCKSSTLSSNSVHSLPFAHSRFSAAGWARLLTITQTPPFYAIDMFHHWV